MGILHWYSIQSGLLLPTLSPGAYPQGHPAPLPSHRVAAPVQRYEHASQEPVLRTAQDVLAMREADPEGHRPHLPRA